MGAPPGRSVASECRNLSQVPHMLWRQNCDTWGRGTPSGSGSSGCGCGGRWKRKCLKSDGRADRVRSLRCSGTGGREGYHLSDMTPIPCRSRAAASNLAHPEASLCLNTAMTTTTTTTTTARSAAAPPIRPISTGKRSVRRRMSHSDENRSCLDGETRRRRLIAFPSIFPISSPSTASPPLLYIPAHYGAL